MNYLTTGDRVVGSYMGEAEFTGTVELARPHTVAWDQQVVVVRLDAPITVLGLERNRLALEVDGQGRGTFGTVVEIEGGDAG